MAQVSEQKLIKDQTKSSANSKPSKTKPSYKHIPHSQKPPHLVAKRNARERRRVQAVNQAFYKLRKCVPIENRNKRVSKVKTLQRAIDYIRKLERILEEDEASAISGPQARPTTQVSTGQPVTSSTSLTQIGSELNANETNERRTIHLNAGCNGKRKNCDQGGRELAQVKQKRGRKPNQAPAFVQPQQLAGQMSQHQQHQLNQQFGAQPTAEPQTETEAPISMQTNYYVANYGVAQAAPFRDPLANQPSALYHQTYHYHHQASGDYQSQAAYEMQTCYDYNNYSTSAPLYNYNYHHHQTGVAAVAANSRISATNNQTVDQPSEDYHELPQHLIEWPQLQQQQQPQQQEQNQEKILAAGASPRRAPNQHRQIAAPDSTSAAGSLIQSPSNSSLDSSSTSSSASAEISSTVVGRQRAGLRPSSQLEPMQTVSGGGYLAANYAGPQTHLSYATPASAAQQQQQQQSAANQLGANQAEKQQSDGQLAMIDQKLAPVAGQSQQHQVGQQRHSSDNGLASRPLQLQQSNGSHFNASGGGGDRQATSGSSSSLQAQYHQQQSSFPNGSANHHISSQQLNTPQAQSMAASVNNARRLNAAAIGRPTIQEAASQQHCNLEF